MSGVQPYFVDCIQDGQVLRNYEFGVPRTLAGAPAPDHDDLVRQAKSNLTTEGLGFPPYSGIQFRVRAG